MPWGLRWTFCTHTTKKNHPRDNIWDKRPVVVTLQRSVGTGPDHWRWDEIYEKNTFSLWLFNGPWQMPRTVCTNKADCRCDCPMTHGKWIVRVDSKSEYKALWARGLFFKSCRGYLDRLWTTTVFDVLFNHEIVFFWYYIYMKFKTKMATSVI